MKVIPVILAGGIGERFWPMSRSTMPKQLHALCNKKSMLQETIERVVPLCTGSAKPMLITSSKIAEKTLASLPDDIDLELIGEPQGKNTAPAIALAAARIRKSYGDAVMLVVSADHVISPKKEFLRSVRYAISIAEESPRLIIFGIKPSRAETGYGYIELGRKIGENNATEAFEVKRFIEKPSITRAQRFFRSQNFLWNSGMFIWRCSVIIKQFELLMPQIHTQMNILARNQFSKNALENYYRNCCKESVDYGIMEKSKNVAVVSGNFNWDDIGSWESLSRIEGKDSRNNTIVGKNIVQKECSDALIVNRSKISLLSVGLHNIALVIMDDAILAIERSLLPQLKTYLEEIKSKKELPDELF